jgi:hypothetical protein
VRGEVEEFLRLYTIDETLAALAKDSQVVYFRPPEEEREPDQPSPELDASGFYETEPAGDDTLN